MSQEQKPPFPPFTQETAQIKVKAAQDVWNTKYAYLSNQWLQLLTIFPETPLW